jgi:hypothetical protein
VRHKILEVLAMQEIDKQALAQMRHAQGRWAAYQNVAFDSDSMGHMQFLKFGAECTYETPPKTYPVDTAHGAGWRYQFIGEVNLNTGFVEAYE